MPRPIESLSVALRAPKDLFLIKESAALAAKAGLIGETLTVTAEDESVLEESAIRSVVVAGTSGQITVFEEVLIGADRASRKVEASTGESRAAYEAGMKDHFRLMGIRLGLQEAA
jgi:hypothetical protein